MIKITSKGDFSNLKTYLEKARKMVLYNDPIHHLADKCIDELRKATPKDSGLTAESWTYEVKQTGKKTTITFLNKNLQNGLNVALLLEYGHGTATGGWVEGREYIDPIISQNYLDAINNSWKEMTKL